MGMPVSPKHRNEQTTLSSANNVTFYTKAAKEPTEKNETAKWLSTKSIYKNLKPSFQETNRTYIVKHKTKQNKPTTTTQTL